MLQAIRSPYETILDNAGYQIIEEHDKPGVGFDVVSGDRVDMVAAGIIDPVLVTKTALKNAVSVALTIISADCVISNIRVNEGD